MLDATCLEKIKEFIESGDLKFEFENGTEERRYELLDMLELLMELGEQADELATKLIFKDGFMEILSGVKRQ